MKYSRRLLEQVQGYVPGEQPQTANVIKLNTNENPYPPSPKVIEAVRQIQADNLRRYPDPLSLTFRALCAERYGYPGPEWVVAGNGMDELLAMAVRTFADPGDTIVTTYPTYTLYETLALLHGARIEMVDLDDAFQLPPGFFETPGRICFLGRPNSPTGVSIPREDAERLCATFKGLVVIDEAYVDFAGDHCMDFPRRFENAIVMRTFSKSFSLAGMRIGLAVARPELISEFLKTKDSYNLDIVSQAAGVAAMGDYEHMLANVKRVCATRDRLTDGLLRLGFAVLPSQSNFVLAQWNRTPTAKTIFRELRARGIIVRYFEARRLQDALRISVGTDEETDRLLVALREILE